MTETTQRAELPDHAMLMALQRCTKVAVGALVARYALSAHQPAPVAD